MSEPAALQVVEPQHGTVGALRFATALTKFEQAIGGRDVLIEALLHAPPSKDLKYVLGLITEPGNARVSLAKLCVQGGITPGELWQYFQKAELTRATVLAIREVAKRLPEVVKDVMDRSIPWTETCPKCLGATTVPVEGKPDSPPVTCPECRGEGVITLVPDLERQKVALELGALLKKGGGMTITQQNLQLTPGRAETGALERMQEATDKILYGEPASTRPSGLPVIEAEPLPEEQADDWA